MQFEEIIFKKAGVINDHYMHSPSRYFVPDNLHLISLSAKNQEVIGCLKSEVLGSSIALTKKQADLGAMGEYFERYTATCNQHIKYFGSYLEMKKHKNTFNVLELNQFRCEQYEQSTFPYKRINENDKIHWIEAYDYFSNKIIFVPESWAYLIRRNQEFFFPSTSTGLACGSSKEHAIQSGFLEACERNGFSKFWYLQNENNLIKYKARTILETFPNNKDIQNLFKNERVQLSIFDLSEYTLTYTYLVFIEFYLKGEEYFSVGCASRFTKEEALIKAASESYQGIDYAMRIKEDKKELQKLAYTELNLEENIIEFTDHYWFYNAYPEARAKVKIFQFLKDKSDKSFSSKIQEHQHCLQSMKDLSQDLISEMLIVNMSKDEFIDLGFHTYKVICPSLIPLTGEHKAPIIGYKEFEDKNLFLELPHFFP